MRKLFSFFVVAMMFLFAGNVFAQGAVDIHLSATDGITTNNQLRVGLDLTATTGIDPSLGESDLPPFPPSGVFEARFDLSPYGVGSLSTYQDYRNAPAFPYSGTVEHRITWQLGTGATSFSIGYNLPAQATMVIQDIITGTIVNSGTLSGTGNYTITFPITAAKITMTYTNIGTVAAPIFGVSPSSLNFGTVNVGSSATLPVTVSNTGTLALNITGLTSSNPQFTFSPSAPVSIPAGGNQVFNVTFTPTANGSQTGNLVFTHNAAGSPTTYAVQGVGYTPAPVIGFNPASLNFGSIAIGSSSTLPVTINNTGDAQLVLSNIVSSDAQFTFAPNTFPINIAAGGNSIVNVTFTPTAAGNQSANLTFTHNAAGSPSSYSVQGVGFTTAPFFTLNPTSLNFGQVSLNIPSTLPVTVTNTGNAQLVISGAVSSSAQFTFAPNTFPINVAAGGNVVFNVTYTPTTAGILNGNITFTHNAAGSPSVLALTGEGRTQGGTLKFKQNFRTVYDNHLNVQDTVVLSGYTGQPLKALQFDILIGNQNGFLKFNSVSRGSAVPVANYWFDTQVYPGATRPDGSHIDTLRVVILGNGNNAIQPNLPDQEILVFSYDVVSITTPSATTYNSLTRVTGATATPVVNANINAGPWETITIFNGTSQGLLGDVNLDNTVDLLDILTMIDYILGRIPFNAQQMFQGDIAPWPAGQELPTRDGIVNVLDLAVLQNIVLTGLYPSGNPVNKVLGNPFFVSNNSLEKLTPGMDARLTFYLYNTGITVGIESAKKIKGVQLELNSVSLIPSTTQISSVFNTANYYQSNGFLRTLTYDGSSNAIDAGEYTIASLPFSLTSPKDIEIGKIIVADENNQALQKVEVAIKYDDVVPLDYYLSQNFPNPFNPNTKVDFSIPVDGFVTIRVYDLLGQEIVSLFEGNTQAGKYAIQWDGKDKNGNAVSSGNYIYRMVAGDFVQSKKMTYLK